MRTFYIFMFLKFVNFQGISCNLQLSTLPNNTRNLASGQWRRGGSPSWGAWFGGEVKNWGNSGANWGGYYTPRNQSCTTWTHQQFFFGLIWTPDVKEQVSRIWKDGSVGIFEKWGKRHWRICSKLGYNRWWSVVVVLFSGIPLNKSKGNQTTDQL